MAKKDNPDAIVVGHLADSHLRETRYGHMRYGDDFYRGLVSAIEAASPKVDLFVHVGDMFDMARPSPRVIGQLMRIHEKLKSLKRKMLVVTGNHDWNSVPWFSVLFQQVEEFGIEPVDDKVVEYKGFKFCGIRPHSATSFRENTVEIRNLVKGADVVLYHGLVQGVVPLYVGKDKVVLSVQDLPIYDSHKAFLLGDIHIQGYVQDRGCLVGYPGSTEVISDGEAVDKDVPLLRISHTVAEVIGKVSFDTRRYVSAKVRNEDEVKSLLAEVAQAMPENPVIVCQYDDGLDSFLQRLYAVADPLKCLLRPLKLAKNTITNGVFAGTASEEEEQEELTVADFVAAALAGDEFVGLRVLAEALIAQPSEAVSLVAHYVDAEKIKLENIRC